MSCSVNLFCACLYGINVHQYLHYTYNCAQKCPSMYLWSHAVQSWCGCTYFYVCEQRLHRQICFWVYLYICVYIGICLWSTVFVNWRIAFCKFMRLFIHLCTPLCAISIYRYRAYNYDSLYMPGLMQISFWTSMHLSTLLLVSMSCYKNININMLVYIHFESIPLSVCLFV